MSNLCEPSCPFQAFNKYDCIVYPWKNEVETTKSFRLLSKANKVRQASLSRSENSRLIYRATQLSFLSVEEMSTS